ncbi:MAG: efflux RND transporter permease subunit [Alphaproteobacteria bacterium]
MFHYVNTIIQKSIEKPKKAIKINLIIAGIIFALAMLPTLFSSIPLHGLKIDTDPENMLSHTEEARVFHDEMRKTFSLYDILVVGIVSPEKNIFNPESLQKIYELTTYAQSLDGVVSKEVLAPSTVDRITNVGMGVVNFDWLMDTPPTTEEGAQEIYKNAKRIPFLNGTMLSKDGKAIALYIPLKSKDISYKISKLLKEKSIEIGLKDSIYVTGLPVAQDRFGVEMFTQMMVSAPLAMLFIFILMWGFFRNTRFVLSALSVAGLSVIITMGILIISGNTVHIMSSMIPIFIMPIAVLDAIHILSDFFDRYRKTKDRKETMKHVMKTLFKPMLYTTITTVVGFASLAFTPIPPVQVFGIFVALGVLIAWIITVTFLPAYLMSLSDETLEGFGFKKSEKKESLISKFLKWLGDKTSRYPLRILISTGIILVFAFVGVTKIRVNDNPVKWFAEGHELRIADKELNKRFSGTYMAYLSLKRTWTTDEIQNLFEEKGVPTEILSQVREENNTPSQLIENMYDYADAHEENSNMLIEKIEAVEKEMQVFKDPRKLKQIAVLQKNFQDSGYVGKSSSLSDLVKTIHRDLYGKEEAFVIPSSPEKVAETILVYQNSHRPNDLWHFVTPDYTQTTLMLQLKTGDNADMNRVLEHFNDFYPSLKGFENIEAKWFGMTYINVVWQDRMVSGMIKSFLGSFLIVLLLMIVLFRSFAWGALAMFPLSITIVGIYGLIGWIGKDYDMPIAVLSSLSLGLAVDYAIHFLERTRESVRKHKTWEKARVEIFGEPARAILRNVIVVSVGFVPLLFASLLPYQTVGIFISAILFFAGTVTLGILPATLSLFKKWIFKEHEGMTKFTKGMIGLLIILIVLENFIY